MPTQTCRFPLSEIAHWAAKYGGLDNDDNAIHDGQVAREQGYYTREEFLRIGEWKSPRVRRLREQNEESLIVEATRIALSTPEERLCIEVLTILDGVGWPSASVLLHFAHRDRYPILDFRALWSLGLEPISYNFAFWHEYVTCARKLADEAGVGMRTLDRALWAYSSINQPKL